MSAVERLAFITKRYNRSKSVGNDVAANLWDVTAMLIKLNERIKP